MSIKRWAAKRDSIEPAIIQALEERGYDVRQLDRPCDLIARHPSWPGGLFQALEVKTPNRRGRAKLDPRQEAQINFCQSTGTPIVKAPIEAIAIVQIAGERLRADRERFEESCDALPGAQSL